MTDNRLPEETEEVTVDGVRYFRCCICGGLHVIIDADEACGACGLIVYPEDPPHVCDLDPTLIERLAPYLVLDVARAGAHHDGEGT